MSRDWSTLLWLDWSLLRNRVRTVLRTPRRLAAWACCAALLAGGAAARALAGHGAVPDATLPAAVLAPLGAAVPGATLIVYGLLVWRAAASAPVAFRAASGAGWVIGAGVPPRTVLAWLTFRGIRRLMIATGFYVLLAALYLPALGVPGDAATAVVGVALLLALLFGTHIVVFVAALRPRWARLDMAGLAVAALGAVLLGAGLSPLAEAATPVLAALPPGAWVVGAARADPLSMALLAAAAAAAITGGIALAGDCVPELWHATRAAPARPRPSPVRSTPAQLVPRGAAALLWKEWVGFRRGRGTPLLQLGVMAAAITLGIVAGLLCVEMHGAVPFALGYAAVLSALLSNLAAVPLAAELRTPLWWLAADPLTSRLGVLTLARAVHRSAPLVAFTCLVIALAGEPPVEAPEAAVAEVALAWLQQALAAACHTVLPRPEDARAAQILRMVALTAALVPVALALLPGAALNSVTAMLAAVVLVILAEVGILLAVTARRLPPR